MNNEDNDGGSVLEGENAGQTPPQTNFERLLAHLHNGTLAEKLVSACAAAEPGKAALAVKDVMIGRLEELKDGYDAPEDQQN